MWAASEYGLPPPAHDGPNHLGIVAPQFFAFWRVFATHHRVPESHSEAFKLFAEVRAAAAAAAAAVVVVIPRPSSSSLKFAHAALRPT